MKRYIVVAMLVVLSSVVLSCNSNPYFAIRSGDDNNDDVAEPLSEKAEQFEYNLKVTNEVVGHLKKRNFRIIYENYFSDEMRSRVQYENFSNSWKKIFREFGKIQSYKALQWHFVTKNQNNKDLLYSIKIVHHEHQSFNYILIFDNNDRKNLVNFSMKLRKNKG